MPRPLSEQEFTQVRDQVLSSAPPNMNEAQFTQWVGPQMTAALQEAELRGPTAEGSSVGRFASNLGAMVNPVTLAKGAYQMVRHPVDSATAIAGQMGDQWTQAAEAGREGRYSEMIGHGAAGSIPLIGPTAAAIGEQAAEGDVSGAVGATTGLLLPSLVKPVVKGVTRTVGATAPRLRATIAERLGTRAAANISEVMTPQVGPNKLRFGGMAEQVAPELAKRPELAAWSRTGYEAKIGQAFETAVAKLDEAANARLSARTFSTKPIADALRKARQRWVAEPAEASKFPKVGDTAEAFGREVIPPENAARVARIDQALADLDQLGPSAKYESLRRIREAADQSARIKYSPSMTQDFLKASGNASGSADVAGVLRENLAKFDPQTAAANTEYALFKKASDVLEAVAEVERSRPKVGRQLIAKWAGASAGAQAAGLPGAVTGYVLAPILDSVLSQAPTMKLQTAKLMTQLAEAMQKGQTARAFSVAEQLKRGIKLASGVAARAVASGRPINTEPASAPSR